MDSVIKQDTRVIGKRVEPDITSIKFKVSSIAICTETVDWQGFFSLLILHASQRLYAHPVEPMIMRYCLSPFKEAIKTINDLRCEPIFLTSRITIIQ